MNKKAIILTIFVIIGMIVLPTIYKIYKEHNDNLIKVVEKEFLYQAKKCYNAQICKNEIVTLKELYDNNYIKDKLTNPLTKKYYALDSKVNVVTSKIELTS